MKILKRNGEKTEFKKEKIESAILKAMRNGSGIVKENVASDIANAIENLFKCAGRIPTVKEVEGIVYHELVKHGEVETARSYEGYRAIQEYKREVNTTDDSILELIHMENEEVMKENSNKNATVASTQRDLIAGEISKDYSMRKLIPPHIVQAHMEGAIHWHDADYTLQKITNCNLVNLEDMY